MTVNVGSGTSFSIDPDNVDMNSLPFTPTFDSNSVSKGQFVDADSSSGMMSGGGMGGGMMGGGTLSAAAGDGGYRLRVLGQRLSSRVHFDVAVRLCF